MIKVFSKDEIVVHKKLPNIKLKIVQCINPSQYEVMNVITGDVFLCMSKYLLNKQDYRHELISLIFEEKQ